MTEQEIEEIDPSLKISIKICNALLKSLSKYDAHEIIIGLQLALLCYSSNQNIGIEKVIEGLHLAKEMLEKILTVNEVQND